MRDTLTSEAIIRIERGEDVICPVVAKAVLSMKLRKKEVEARAKTEKQTNTAKAQQRGELDTEVSIAKYSNHVPFPQNAVIQVRAFSEDGGVVGALARKGTASTLAIPTSSPTPAPTLVTTSTGATIGHQRRAARSARFVSLRVGWSAKIRFESSLCN